ncbi:DnaJ domain-containing protein [Jimgerdemannia flammicorona]|uniref:DnaJ domain-containing protein n=1 Tax=Jimgerdemannia flammicorona TaxID=994334 RepID=A0A433Q9B1_9FUNG|nr:DnaJ domain-containing protein [Jimgerdemannia flammicorona]
MSILFTHSLRTTPRAPAQFVPCTSFSLIYRTYVAATSSLQRHHYDTLQVPPDAEKKHIKAQYYKLSKEHHPDLNPGDDAAHLKFLRINEAYAVLGNPLTRREYDRELATKQGFADHPTGFRSTRVRPRPHTRGSVSTQAQARASGKRGFDFGRGHQGTQFDFRAHYEKHYAEEEKRRRARMARENTEWMRTGQDDGAWSRFWKIGVVFLGILIVGAVGKERKARNDKVAQ